MQKPKYGNDRNKELMDFLCEEDKSEKLKSCPFCNGKARVEQAYNGQYYVSCMICGIRTLFSDKKNIPIMLWNRRADDE